ncbi:MAG: TIR domain-containing protein [Steroidobacteraceae bacterium]
MTPTAHDIFLSYGHSDVAVAKRFADALEREGFSVWWDTALRSGEAFDQAIEKALKSACSVVVLWSCTSVESRWVRAEATLADRNGTLVPVLIGPCERPIMFELTHTVDLAHWQGAADDRAWLAFLADVRRLVATDRATPAPSLVTAAPEKPAAGERGEAPSLAVLPFTNRSGLPEDEAFAIGMVEDVIDALSQGVFVRVVSSAATARFRAGAIPDLDAMARQLGVRYLLEGNVRRAGDRLRVTAQLVEAANGAILWTQKFERPLSELATLQEQLVLEVAAHLDTQVFRVEMERALKKPGDLTAWEAVMRAVATQRALNMASLAVCVEEASKAVTIAPDYGLAHAVLAMGSGLRYLVLCPDDPHEVRRIRGHAEMALLLDPNNALVLAQASQALSYLGYPQEALRHAERAVRLNPGTALVHYSCGLACLYLNRVEEALTHFNTSLSAAPGSETNFFNYTQQGSANIRAGRWSDAVIALDKALALYPDFPLALMLKAIVYHREGRTDEARELLQHTRRVDKVGTLAVWEWNISRHFVRSPNLDELLALLRSLWYEAERAA